MVKIIREPGSGKTKEIMGLCAAEGATFVCRNPEAMLVKAKSYGYDITIISYIEFLQESSKYLPNCYLDDIDEFLMAIGCDVKGFGGNI